MANVLTVADVFEAMQAHRDMRGITQTLGEAQEGNARPRIVWMMAQDQTLMPPAFMSKPAVLKGEHVHMEGVATRPAGWELKIIVEAGPTPAHLRALEELIRLTHVTLHEVCKGYGNFQPGSGKPLERETLAEGEMGYLLPVTFHVPLYRTVGAVDATGVVATLVG